MAGPHAKRGSTALDQCGTDGLVTMRSHHFLWIGLMCAAAIAGLAAQAPLAQAAKPTGSKTQSDSKDVKTKNKDTKSTPDANAQPSPEKEAKPKPKPIPKTWSAEKIAEERALCQKTLAKIDAIAIPEASFRKGGCGAAAPVRLIAVGTKPQVTLSPPAIMTCRLASAMHRWATQDLQRLAKKHLKDQIIRIEVMSDYSCRNTYGRKIGKLSEHALANAIDIRGFSTADGKVVRLLSAWGPTARDIAAEKARAEKARQAKLEAQRAAQQEADVREAEQSNQAKDVGRKKTPKQIVVKGTKELLDVGKKIASAAKTALKAGTPDPTQVVPLSQRISRQGYFLRAAHKSACKIFGTTLGPEANDAHRNHFHLDMRPRRRSNYCE